MVFQSATEAIIITDAKNQIIEVNPAFEKISGYSEIEVLGENPSIMASGRHDQNFYQDMWASISATGKWQGEVWDRKPSGEVYPKALSITSFQNGNANSLNYLGVFSDITLKIEASEKLANLAFFDPLTGLGNRALCDQELMSRLKFSQRNKTGLAVLFLDLDGFKSVNDSMGHKMGDEVLVLVADKFKETVRESDFVCRHGGDEFLIILSGLATPDDVSKVSTNLLAIFDKPIQLSSGEEARLNTSIGISLSPGDSISPDELIRYADLAMYEAKNAGKGRFYFFKGG